MDAGCVTAKKQYIIHIGNHFSLGSTAQPKLFGMRWNLAAKCLWSVIS